jgi:hypothetical protein
MSSTQELPLPAFVLTCRTSISFTHFGCCLPVPQQLQMSWRRSNTLQRGLLLYIHDHKYQESALCSLAILPVSQACYLSFSFFFFFFFWWYGVWTQGLRLARQALLPLEPFTSPFFVMDFLTKYCLELFVYLLRAGFEPRSSWSLPPEKLGLQMWPTGFWLKFWFSFLSILKLPTPSVPSSFSTNCLKKTETKE